jgi:hypothetical protein
MKIKILHLLVLVITLSLAGCQNEINFPYAATETIKNKIFDKSPSVAANGVKDLLYDIFSNYDEYCEQPIGNMFYRLQVYTVKSDGSSKVYRVAGEIKLHMIDSKAKIITIDGDFSIPSFMKKSKHIGQYENKIIKEFEVNGETWYGIYSAEENTIMDYRTCSDAVGPDNLLPSRVALTNSKEALDALIADNITALLFL